jgi:Flp pilus assembly pilin Flp
MTRQRPPRQARISKTAGDPMSKQRKFADGERGVTTLAYTILIGIITVAVILVAVLTGSWGTPWPLRM